MYVILSLAQSCLIADCCYILQNLSLSRQWLETTRSFGFLNICINPLIYAARYEVFKLSLKKMLKKDNVVAPINVGN